MQQKRKLVIIISILLLLGLFVIFLLFAIRYGHHRQAVPLHPLPTHAGKTVKQADAVTWQAMRIHSGDSLAKLFAQHAIKQKYLVEILAHSQKNAVVLSHLKVGHSLYLRAQGDVFHALVYEIANHRWLWVKRQATKYVSEIKKNPFTKQTQALASTSALRLQQPVHKDQPALAKTAKAVLASTSAVSSHQSLGDHKSAGAKKPSPVLAGTSAVSASQSVEKSPVKDGDDLPVKYVSATIHQSLYVSARKAGLTPKQIVALEKIFGDQVDFAHDIKSGDHFSALLAAKNSGQAGNIVAAELFCKGKEYKAIRFVSKNGHAHYYTPQGHSLRTSLLRAPLHYAYISSPFSLHRWHPVLHRYRPHYGVDYAAKIGTPIKAAGNGRIVFRGRRSGFGRVIAIRHNAKYETVYAHMSAFNKKLHVGSRVRQNQVIGYVGESGLATGPHLHYEIHVNNRPRNPQTVALPSAPSVPKRDRPLFLAQSKQLLADLAFHQHTLLADSKNHDHSV